MVALPSLRGLQAFEAAARTGSFAAAAEELSVSAAAVSQLIRTVEEQMGRKLFHRVNRRAVLTEAGVEMLPRLSMAFREIGSVARDVGGDAFRPRLVISVPPSMAMGWLSERLAGFVAGHGAADISLRGDDDPVPFEHELIDIRLSYGPHYREHPTEEIVRDAVYPVCAPELLRKAVPGSEPLAGLPLIHTDWGPTGASFPSWRNWFEAAGNGPGRAAQRGLSANSSRAALDLAISGLGVALAQGVYCAQALEDGRLVRPVARSLALRQQYCLTIPERSARRDIVTAFREWLIGECASAVGSPALGAAAQRRL
ncbi:LysR family transcriptional regulator [Mesorhizobium sp. M2D.F.Ca.ET.185.01.1.1]|uniref:LysR substrate-binding domain-containing protein n=2 Tax=Mesorhizobium TaxID=68287 RepID=UPI000FCA8095|nr:MULTISPECIES: LysR substrate-binding domain-containing protein [unclassified Mesorhizobium]TGP76411.1 LysR family transcriptional regulator [bacterium M00.F.Ca.ET.227.01.1.1]TGP92463.1 LysR family transcriptional regulator [bacterium M00.F.Ca.ET.222.01.1.1]TGP97018.1 LysR family transcriptional regulator [bacterium M00.F.Ca.ET.221.01.1.1]TGU06522.1 LysR family transcriptional regulator [bacterium M00.F.Ca.ET.163.01.1.1]TGU27852.1 LysR family transcriptional regulator [bacterium M00.F.Ca.ET.